MTRDVDSASVLWESASVLRGAVQPLAQLDIVRCLFFLRCATWGAILLGRDRRRLRVPSDASWSVLRRTEEDLAQVLSRACQCLEEANPEIKATLTLVDFEQIEPGHEGRRDRILKILVEELSRLPELDDPREVGDIYDAFVVRFAETAGKGAAEVFLSMPLANLMVEMLGLKNQMRVSDPACNAGRTLAACASKAARSQIDLVLHGQERSVQLRAICKMNLLLHGAGETRVDLGDSLYSPMLNTGGHLEKYDRVITAPPIHRHWGAEDASEDRFGRFPVVPPKHVADYAYILHSLAILREGGAAVILTGRGVLFRRGGEEPVRKRLIKDDCIEVVVALPGGLLYGTHIPAALIILRKRKTKHRNRVLFVDVRRFNDQRSRHDAIGEEQVDFIVTCIRRFESVEDLSRVVSTEEIEQNEWVLNPAIYVPHGTASSDIDFAEQIENIERLEIERDHAASRVDELIARLREQLDL